MSKAIKKLLLDLQQLKGDLKNLHILANELIEAKSTYEPELYNEYRDRYEEGIREKQKAIAEKEYALSKLSS